jgi:hypothetical protein
MKQKLGFEGQASKHLTAIEMWTTGVLVSYILSGPALQVPPYK